MKPKTILVLIALFFALTMQAAGKAWCLVTDKGEVVELSHVNYFLASSEETFDIVCSDGSSIKGVISISVEERNLSGIQEIRNDDGQFSQLVGDNLIVSGLKSATQAQVLSLSGCRTTTYYLMRVPRPIASVGARWSPSTATRILTWSCSVPSRNVNTNKL